MVEQDTIRLLRECDAGVKMGVSSIDDVLEYVSDEDFKKLLIRCKDEHIELNDKVQKLLVEYHDEGKDPNPMAKSMSWMKTNMKIGMDNSDATIADLVTDGCNMGVKSLHNYLNQYKAADETSKGLCKDLISIEEELCKDLQKYL